MYYVKGMMYFVLCKTADKIKLKYITRPVSVKRTASFVAVTMPGEIITALSCTLEICN